MIYECDQCSKALPAGVMACPNCGEKFDEAVPTDAQMPRRGFSAASVPDKPFTSLPGAVHTSPASAWNQKVSGRALVAMIAAVGIGVFIFDAASNSGKPTSPAQAVSPQSIPSPIVSSTDTQPNDNSDSNADTGSSGSQTPADVPPLAKGSEHFSKESGFDIISGEVTNVGSDKLDNLEAVTTFYDDIGNVVTTEDAIIDFNPLMPGQTSPYKTMGTDNPLIKTEKTAFHEMGGPLIAYSEKGDGAEAGKSDAAADGNAGDSHPNRDPLSETAGSGSGLSDRPLRRSILQNATVTEADLAGKSLAALSISYNTIYAVHGYVFKRRSLQRVFDGMSWYHQNPAFAESDLTPIEKGNLKTIRAFERKQFGY